MRAELPMTYLGSKPSSRTSLEKISGHYTGRFSVSRTVALWFIIVLLFYFESSIIFQGCAV
jgi:hypothetical protein